MRLFLMILMLPAASQATTYAVQVTGLFSDAVQINYADMYDESNTFSKLCANSSLRMNCNLLVNPDSKLNPGQAKLDTSLKPVTPTKENTLEAFKQALINAKPGDQVVFSMTDHGDRSFTGQSCTHISDKDEICQGDLADVLHKYKKPGTTVLLSMNACFSGGLADIAKRDVCVNAGAPRDRYSHFADRGRGFANSNFWAHVDGAIKNGNPHPSFADVHVPFAQMNGFDALSGSQLKTAAACDSVHAELSKLGAGSLFQDNTLNALTTAANGALAASPNADCTMTATSLHNSFKNSNAWLSGFLTNPAFVKLARGYCGEMTDSNRAICEPLRRVLGKIPQIKEIADRVVPEINKLKARADELERESDKIAKALDTENDSPEAQKEMDKRIDNPAAYLGKSTNQALLSHGLTPKGAALEKQQAALQAKADTLAVERINEIRDYFKSLSDPQLRADLEQVSTCLTSQEAPLTQGEKDMYGVTLPGQLHISDTHPATAKDIKEAQECEQSFRF